MFLEAQDINESEASLPGYIYMHEDISRLSFLTEHYGFVCNLEKY